jgi:hypothetical protein
VIANRRTYRDFYVPSIPDQFTYYLLKKVLKQSITPHQLKRLQHLLARNPAECRQRIAKFRPDKAAVLQRAIAEHDFRGFRRELPELYCELQASRPIEPLLSRFTGKLREMLRCSLRAMRPTGMSVCIAGGDFEQRARLAEELAHTIGPAFRRARLLTPSASGSFLRKRLTVCADRIRSTLVIYAADDTSATGSRRLSRMALAPDLTIVLDPKHPALTHSADYAAGAIHLSAAQNSQELVQHASGAVLQWLAARLRTRFRLQELPALNRAGDAHEPQLSLAGSD